MQLFEKHGMNFCVIGIMFDLGGGGRFRKKGTGRRFRKKGMGRRFRRKGMGGVG